MPLVMQTDDQSQSKAVRGSFKRLRQQPASGMREDILMLHKFGFHMDTISEMLQVSREDVRAVCPESAKRQLSRRVLNILVKGRHASVGGKSAKKRTRNVARIAATYTVDELLDEPGIGRVLLADIELWLEAQGLALRNSE